MIKSEIKNINSSTSQLSWVRLVKKFGTEVKFINFCLNFFFIILN